MRKRIVSLLLSLALCLTLLPTAAFAEEAQQEELLPGEQLEQVQPVQEEPEENEEQSQQDEDVIAVQALINALPDASALGEMDAEALESACLAASEAYDAYDDLTEGQRSALTGAEKMIAILEWATRQIELLANEDLSDHTIHGEGWTAWDSRASASYQTTLPDKAGKYYLTDNVTLTATWAPPSGTVLCLNGKSITANGKFNAITIGKDVTFTLCDCTEGQPGKVTHGKDANDATFTGSGVYVNGKFNMYGGSITDNTVGNKSGGGVYVSATGTFNMYGGTISGNSGVNGGGVYSQGTFTMKGGTITQNTAQYGGGVWTSSSFTVSGNVMINGNTLNNDQTSNNVFPSLIQITIGTEGLEPEARIGVTKTMNEGDKFVTVATLAEGAKYTTGNIFSDRGEPTGVLLEDGENGKVVNLYSAMPHKHPICGKSCAHNSAHSNVVWQPISDETELQAATAGYYYLKDYITLTKTWTPAKDVVLCLNGYSITGSATETVITVKSGVTFTLTDCNSSNTGNGKVTHNEGAKGRGVYVNGGTFKMYGGSITGNMPSSGSGGGVFVERGRFEMYGGSITGNKTATDYGGGGVYVSNSGQFTMSGSASITGNTAKCGGGVYVDKKGAFTMESGTIGGRKGNTASCGGGVYVCGDKVAVDTGSFTMTNGSITGNTAESISGGGVYVGEKATFTMNNGSITGNEAENSDGGGVYVNSGTFTMTAGSITGNTAHRLGGGVYVYGGTFTMNNGSITGNKTNRFGGGVCVDNSGQFTMTDGSITGNTADNGGGVYVESGTFTVSGPVNITDNCQGGTLNSGKYTGGTKNNVYLANNNTITIDKGLKDAARIGVTTGQKSAQNPIKIATDATGGLKYTTIFTPDAKNCVVTEDGSGNLFLTAHQHSWKYEASGATITAKCTAVGCSLADDLGGSVTISAPGNLDYDGTEKRPNIQSDKAWQDNIGETKGVCKYYRNDAAVERVIDAGTYKVEYYVEGGKNAVASVEYTIKPATITVTPKNGQSKKYGETDPELTYTTSIDSDTTLAQLFNTAKAGKLGRKAGENVDSYAITLGDLSAGSNFNLTLDSSTTVNFTITPADYSYAVAAAQDFRAGSGLSAITAPANGSGVKGETVDGTLDWYSDSGRTKAAVDADLSSVTADHTVTLYWKFTATNTNYTNTPKEGATVFTAKDKTDLSSSIDVSGISNLNKTYDGNAAAYTGRATVTGHTDLDDTLVYEWYDASGLLSSAPTNAGNYRLTVKVPDTNPDYMGQKVINFTIEQKSISTMTVTLDKTEVEYNGSSQSVTASVAGLTAGTDYTVTGNTGTTVASYTVTVTGTGNYKGNATATWKITQATPNVGTVSYTGGTIYTSTALSAISLNKDGTATGTLALNADQTLTAGMQEYNWTFTPSDTTNYKTVTGKVSLTVAEDALVSIAASGTLSKPSYKYGENFNPDGLTVTATYASGKNRTLTSGEYTVTNGTMIMGQTEVTLTYQGKTCTVSGLTVSKADAQTLTDITVNQKYSVTTEQSKDIGRAGMPEDAGTLSYAKGSESTTGSATIVFAVDGSTVKFTITGGANGEVITLPVTITSDNYADSIVNVKITLTDKDIPTVSANGITVTYDGNAIPDSKITGTAAFNGNTVEGTWSFKSTAPKFVADSNDSVAVVFTPKDATTYAAAETNIKVTINKAIPTGTPTYTAITTSGKTLRDAALGIGSITPAGGTITWDAGNATVVAANTAYDWTYMPTDTANYDNLTGKITPYVVSSSGGGGGSGSSSSKPTTHPVKAEVSKDPDGSVSLSKTSAAKGDKVTITVKPERHYEVDEVIVRDSKGKQLAVKDNGDGTFTFEMPADKVTVEPTFSWVNPFADVANNAYYVDAVEWMLKREVTQGTTETTFGPDLNCTRAQIVTFLWRVAGSPEAKGTVSFADVSTGSYYAKAVAWAIENGITGGTGDGLFSPDAACTRAQSAAFLYRAAGSPAVNGSAGFSDVAADAYYAQAVAWAKEHGITDGIGGGLFGSTNDCTRAQIVTFLYRAYQGK